MSTLQPKKTSYLVTLLKNQLRVNNKMCSKYEEQIPYLQLSCEVLVSDVDTPPQPL